MIKSLNLTRHFGYHGNAWLLYKCGIEFNLILIHSRLVFQSRPLNFERRQAKSELLARKENMRQVEILLIRSCFGDTNAVLYRTKNVLVSRPSVNAFVGVVFGVWHNIWHLVGAREPSRFEYNTISFKFVIASN